jgi:hypothetical protein
VASIVTFAGAVATFRFSQTPVAKRGEPFV